MSWKDKQLKLGWVRIGSYYWWRYAWLTRHRSGWCGVFRNTHNRKLGRWGFWFLGFEFGSRDPDHWFGHLLKRFKLWPF